jgi:hypothetical protein
VDGADDLAAIDALEADARDSEVGVPELPLDHDERDTFMRHLNRMGMPQLMRRESPSAACSGSRVVKLLARGGGFPMTAGSRSVYHAQQRSGWELAADPHARVELVPRPAIHADLAALASLAAANEDRATSMNRPSSGIG